MYKTINIFIVLLAFLYASPFNINCIQKKTFRLQNVYILKKAFKDNFGDLGQCFYKISKFFNNRHSDKLGSTDKLLITFDCEWIGNGPVT